MPYSSIPPAWIEAGKPTKEEIFDLIRSNQESFNTDIEALKQTSRIDILDFNVSGFIEDYTQTEIDQIMPIFRAPVDATITQVLITLLSASTSGALQLQIEKSTDNGINWTPLLSTPVEITGTTVGSISGAVSFTSVAAQSFDENDLLRVKVEGLQVNQGNFHVSIYGELA
ncbi:MAG: hypothetical protein ACRCW1_05885 [Anaerotignaceae bacterium]